jgi:putative transposase
VRKLRRADELAAASKSGEEMTAELGVSPATLYNWRPAYGAMDPDAAKKVNELREQNGRLKRSLVDAELEKGALREVAKGNVLSSAAKHRALGMLKDTLRMSESMACTVVGLARSTYERLSLAATWADPDAQLRAWLRGYAIKHPCHGFRRAWVASLQACRGVSGVSGRGECAEGAVGDRFPV